MFDVFGLKKPKMAALWLTNQTRRAVALQMRQPLVLFCSINWNLSNTDDLSYFLSIIVAVVYGKFAVIQFWQNL